MTEREKRDAGLLYLADESELLAQRQRCKDACFAFNGLLPSDVTGQETLLRGLLGKTGARFAITAPFWCDYGDQISLGENFYANHNCVILDCAPVTFGDNVFLGPNCCFSTAGHPLDAEQRALGLEFARPIVLEDDVWLGANVTVLPGVRIGAGAVIGAGSVVTKDVPPGVVAVGNPCRVLRAVEREAKTVQ